MGQLDRTRNPLTRQSLIGRLEQWDDDASWREFFDTYWRLIYTQARRSGLTEDEAQDVVQDTVVSVAKKMRDFNYDPSRGSFKGWLRQLIRWRIIDRQRKFRPEEVELPAIDDRETSELERLPDPLIIDQDEVWDRDWRENLFDRTLEIVKTKVAAKQYQIYDLHVVKQMEVKAVAEALGVSDNQVYLAKNRINDLIREELKRLDQDAI